MSVISFWKFWFADLRKAGKKSDFFFCFLDNCTGICCYKFSLLRRWYLPSAVNVLTKNPTIPDINKTEILHLNFPGSHGKISQKSCCADFSRLRDRLACWLSKDVLKQGFLYIYLPLLSQSEISKIQKAERPFFISKCLKIDVDFRNAGKNGEKLFPGWIIVFELFVINSPYYEENICHRQSMC